MVFRGTDSHWSDYLIILVHFSSISQILSEHTRPGIHQSFSNLANIDVRYPSFFIYVIFLDYFRYKEVSAWSELKMKQLLFMARLIAFESLNQIEWTRIL